MPFVELKHNTLTLSMSTSVGHGTRTHEAPLPLAVSPKLSLSHFVSLLHKVVKVRY